MSMVLLTLAETGKSTFKQAGCQMPNTVALREFRNK